VRVFVVAAPMQGHLLPLIPLALACRDAGHEVILASGTLPIGPTGLRLHDIGRRFSLPRSGIAVGLRHPRLLRAELAGRAGTAFVGELFGRASHTLVGPLLRLAEREPPDLIVYDSLGEAGALVAGRLGVPSVQHETTLSPAADLFRAVAQSSGMRRRIVQRVPLHRVLPHAAGFVHHGGAGSVLNGLAAGVPQLVVPGPGDRRYNAELLTRRGAGLAAAAADISADHLTRLLTDPGLRTAAQQVSAEIAAMPAPTTVVPKLEALTRT
jgi:hypothetical protein